MIIHECDQGSEDWMMLRCGIPTASSFDRVITPKTRKRSTQLEAYAWDLVAERMKGEPLETVKTAWMQQGTEREPQAVAAYAFDRGVEPYKVGFITTDDGRIGASPDRLIPGTDGAIEAKCPIIQTHLAYLMGEGPGPDYFCQLQGQMLVGEFNWIDIVSFHPGFPDRVVRVNRDEEFIKSLELYLNELCEIVDLRMHKLAQAGYTPRVREFSEVPTNPIWMGEEAVNDYMAEKFAH